LEKYLELNHNIKNNTDDDCFNAQDNTQDLVSSAVGCVSQNDFVSSTFVGNLEKKLITYRLMKLIKFYHLLKLTKLMLLVLLILVKISKQMVVSLKKRLIFLIYKIQLMLKKL
jgi:hypothetical protein